MDASRGSGRGYPWVLVDVRMGRKFLRLKLPPDRWWPTDEQRQPHGTWQQYARGCRCSACLKAAQMLYDETGKQYGLEAD